MQLERFLSELDIVVSVVGVFSLILMGIIKFSQNYQHLNDVQIEKLLLKEKNEQGFPFLTGFTLAAIIQSSTLVVGMLMNFIHGKLINIKRSYQLVWGANVGASLGLWILLLPGQQFAFELLGVGFILTMLVGKYWFKHIGQIILGLGLIFLSLKIFEEYLLFSHFQMSVFFDGFSVRIFVIYAWLLLAAFLLPSTVMILAPLVSMTHLGLIPLTQAYICVLIVNLGSSIKAVSYVKKGKHNSHLLAYMHILLNFISFWLFLCLVLFTPFINWQKDLFIGLPTGIILKLAGFNSFYFVSMFWGQLIKNKFIDRYSIEHDYEDDYYSWNFDHALIPAIPLLLARQQIFRLASYVGSLVEISFESINGSGVDAKSLGQIKLLEGKTDRIHLDLRRYLAILMKRKLNVSQSTEALGYLRIADDLESLADYLDKMVSLRATHQSNINQSEHFWQNFTEIELELLDYFNELKIHFEEFSLVNKTDLINKLDGLRFKTHSIRSDISGLGLGSKNSGEELIVFSEMHQILNKIRSHLYRLTDELSFIYEKKQFLLNEV